MSDIPEAVLATAFDLVEAMQSNKMDALTAGDARYANMLTDDANAIARALMAAAKEADEAATKRAAKVVAGFASSVSDTARENNSAAFRMLKAVETAILKGEA